MWKTQFPSKWGICIHGGGASITRYASPVLFLMLSPLTQRYQDGCRGGMPPHAAKPKRNWGGPVMSFHINRYNVLRPSEDSPVTLFLTPDISDLFSFILARIWEARSRTDFLLTRLQNLFLYGNYCIFLLLTLTF